MTIRNTGTVDLRIGHTSEEAGSTANFIELNVGEVKKFEIHYGGLEPVRNTGIYKQIFHCEWSDDLFVRNANGIAGEVEIFEVY